MKWKKNIVTSGFILLLSIAVVVAYKKGYIDLSSHARNIEVSDSKEETKPQEEIDSQEEAKLTVENNVGLQEETTEEDRRPKEKVDESLLVYEGEEYTYEWIRKDKKGNVEDTSIRYKFKNLGCNISKEKPQGISINFENETDADGTLLNDYYYVCFSFEVTNLYDDWWKNYGFSKQGFRIGLYNEDGIFTIVAEPTGAGSARGTFTSRGVDTWNVVSRML